MRKEKKGKIKRKPSSISIIICIETCKGVGCTVFSSHHITQAVLKIAWAKRAGRTLGSSAWILFDVDWPYILCGSCKTQESITSVAGKSALNPYSSVLFIAIKRALECGEHNIKCSVSVMETFVLWIGLAKSV